MDPAKPRTVARRWDAPAEPEAGARCGETHWWKAYALHSLVDGTLHRAAMAAPCLRADDERARARRVALDHPSARRRR